VLVLDDEPAIRAGMATLLKRLGCEVASAATVEAARTAAMSFAPLIVLADYRLGDGPSGIDAIASLRSDRPGLLALLISGDTAPDRLREASESGIPLLHKPVTMDQLRRALSALLTAET
jgi:two-component system, sensor histidine kinase